MAISTVTAALLTWHQEHVSRWQPWHLMEALYGGINLLDLAQVARQERVRLGAGSPSAQLVMISTPELLAACRGRVAAFAADPAAADDFNAGMLCS